MPTDDSAVLFNEFDRNDDGYISKREFVKHVKSLVKTHGKHDLTKREIRRFFDSFDSNADEKIDFQEFKTEKMNSKFWCTCVYVSCWTCSWTCWWLYC